MLMHHIRRLSSCLLLSTICLVPAQAREVEVAIPGAQLIATRTVLSNGNLVVVDFSYDHAGVQDVGAVYLLAPDGTLISTLHGTAPGDIGGNVVVLPGGNYLVLSSSWDNGSEIDAGAVTWCDADVGLNGPVSAQNSLVGERANSFVGASGTNTLTLLSNGNYLLSSSLRDAQNGFIGAITWGSGSSGTSGVISAANSMVGQPQGPIGSGGIFALPNGHAVALSPFWDSPTQADVGAVTWINGEAPMSGTVSASNSTIGAFAADRVGSGGLVALPNGHFVVLSPNWTAGEGSIPRAGAASWHNGFASSTGSIGPANALVGTASDDLLGASVVPLTNANYVLVTPGWDQPGGFVQNLGAVTWASGTSPASGNIGPTRSLVGSVAQDQVGSGGVQALSGGGYVVASPLWNNGTGMGDVGAVNWGNGLGVIAAPVSAGNALIGSSFGEQVGSKVRVLSNGNFVVATTSWSGGRGAVAWGNGASGIIGTHSASNSLIGSQTNDRVGSEVLALPNGHYVVSSPDWGNGSTISAGAVTWGNGLGGTTGSVSQTNSTVGTSSNDRVGNSIYALTNGHYVIFSPSWRDPLGFVVGAITWRNGNSTQAGTVGAGNSMLGTGASGLSSASIKSLRNGHYLIVSPNAVIAGASQAGLVSWGNGNGGTIGTLSSANALQGRSSGDRVGATVTELENGHYLVSAPSWDSPTAVDVGAHAWGSGVSGVSGFMSPANALTGSRTGDGTFSFAMTFPDGNYAIRWEFYDHPPLTDSGAYSLIRGSLGTVGEVGPANSLLGLGNGDGVRLALSYDAVRHRGVFTRNFVNPLIYRSFDVLLDLGAAPGPAAGSLALTATLTGSRPEGTLRFTHSADVAIAGCEAVPLAGSGDVRTATCITSALPLGEIPVQVRYAGDANNEPGTLTQTVSNARLFADGFE